jgi:cell fate regulator YaaT (PSP1 superfamily)
MVVISTPPADVGLAGVRFRNSRRMYLCRVYGHDLRIDDYALVHTSQGPEMGKVVMGTAAGSDNVATAGREVIRLATDADKQKVRWWMNQELAAQIKFLSITTAEGLEVSAVRACYSFDGKRLTFRFRTPGSVLTTTLRDRLRAEFAERIVLRALSPGPSTQSGGCGSGGCTTCPSNGLRDRMGAEMPQAGLAPHGAFAMLEQISSH